MAYLANHDGRRVLINEVAQSMAIPKAFLSKIMKELVGAELVKSQVGPGGGYELARAASDITFQHILEVVEGQWTLVPCQGDSGGDTCQMHTSCSQVGVWDEIRGEMLKILASYNLEQVKSRGFGDLSALVQISGAAG